MNKEYYFPAVDSLRKKHIESFDINRKKHSDMICAVYTDAQNGFEKDNRLFNLCHYLKCFADNYPVIIDQNELIVGTAYHWGGLYPLNVPAENIGHYIADYESILTLGIGGLLKKCENINADNEIKKQNQKAFISVLNSLSVYIKRYAAEALRLSKEATEQAEIQRFKRIYENCMHLSVQPAESFEQALQMVWFTHIFLQTEAITSPAISFGRIDRYLYPYYKADKDTGVLSDELTLEHIMRFYIKTCECDESQMITLGGADERENNQENELSLLFLKAQTYLNMRQPSIAVRINKNSSNEFLKAAEELTATGNGMPAYINDLSVIPGLENEGIDRISAADYGIVGCYEASPQGVYSNTVIAQLNLYDSFNDFISENTSFESFEEFISGYKSFFLNYYKNSLIPYFRGQSEHLLKERSPFSSLLFKGCLDSGYLASEYGCKYMLMGLNILGIGLLIDSFYTVKKLVFDLKAVNLKYLCEQCKANFEDEKLFEKIKTLKGSYGSNRDESNLLARDISEFIGNTIRENPFDKHFILSPALFRFIIDIYQRDYPATLNGRKKGELLSYGIAPCATPHAHQLTDILMSCSNIASELFPYGCPLQITVSDKDFSKPGIITNLVKSYFECSGFHLAVNVTNAEILENAYHTPEEYRELMIKISGYSTNYTKLSKAIQTALIERAKSGV